MSIGPSPSRESLHSSMTCPGVVFAQARSGEPLLVEQLVSAAPSARPSGRSMRRRFTAARYDGQERELPSLFGQNLHVSMLEQHRRQLIREREKKLRLGKDVQTISARLHARKTGIAPATSEGVRKSRQREVDRLERELLRAEAKIVTQDKVIASLEKRVTREEDAERRRQSQAQDTRDRERARRDEAVERDLGSLADTTSALEARLTAVEAASLNTLSLAVATDRVPRRYDVFLSFATPDLTLAAGLRDELQARDLTVWMADAQVALGESLVTAIDNGIGSSRCGICLVTPAYVSPDRFWPRQELAALIMGRKRVIPVIAGLTFEDVEDFSALLGDRKGLSTDAHGLDEVADLIAESLRS